MECWLARWSFKRSLENFPGSFEVVTAFFFVKVGMFILKML